MSVDEHLRAWLRAVFAMLADGRSCFEHGAIVVETTRSAGLEALFGAVKAASHKRVIAGTHRLLLSPRLHQKSRLCNVHTPPCSGLRLLQTSKQLEYALDPKLTELCKAGSPAKGVVLFNSFAFGSRRFLFLKLEENVGMSLGHVIDAFKHYILHSKQHIETRAEDDFRKHTVAGIVNRAANDIFVLQSAAAKRGLSAAKLNMVRTQSNHYNRHVRVGNEFFLPGPLADSLLYTNTG